MREGHETVLCCFCAKPVENDNQWAVCEACWYSGVYLRWLIAELDYVELDTERHRELVQAFIKITATPWRGPGKNPPATVVGSWKAAAIRQARPEDRERVMELTAR